jgi:hypothetical protein
MLDSYRREMLDSFSVPSLNTRQRKTPSTRRGVGDVVSRVRDTDRPFCSQGSTVAPVIHKDDRGTQGLNNPGVDEFATDSSIEAEAGDNTRHYDDSHSSLSFNTADSYHPLLVDSFSVPQHGFLERASNTIHQEGPCLGKNQKTAACAYLFFVSNQ